MSYLLKVISAHHTSPSNARSSNLLAEFLSLFSRLRVAVAGWQLPRTDRAATRGQKLLIVVWPFTAPVSCIVDVAAQERCLLWVRAQREGARNHAGARIIVLKMDANDPIRCLSLFHPIDRRSKRIENIRTRTATANAVPHSGYHEEPSELLCA